MKTVDYNLKIEGGFMRVRVPAEQLKIFSKIRKQERFQTDMEAFREAKKLYIEQFPEEAAQFYPVK